MLWQTLCVLLVCIGAPRPFADADVDDTRTSEGECVLGDDGTCLTSVIDDCVDSHASCLFWQEKGEVSDLR
jgi:hypothetical protein